ncbi:MAG: HD domain-containing protein [Candidatus Alcyoniella australis]|nr:HD domain-containing protein [Candidatus Alcyoniella australis]
MIMVTGEPNYETAAEAVRQGAFDYLAKPLKIRDIRLVVGRAAGMKALQDDKQRLEQQNLEYQRRLESLVDERTVNLRKANEQLKQEISQRKLIEAALHESLEKLGRTVKEIIYAMSLTVEKRDMYTAGHQIRVARIARAIAMELKLDPNSVEGVYMAGMIHDVGKIGVPAEIVLQHHERLDG